MGIDKVEMEENLKEKERKIHRLKEYFTKMPEVAMAFLFGSRVKGAEREVSDWDVAVYFKPGEYVETEVEREFPGEDRMWLDLMGILKTDDVDLVVLNRAVPSLVYHVLREGYPLVMRDRGLYLDLLCKVSYEAEDWWNFVSDYWEISERARSLSPEDRSRVLRYLQFLGNEFEEIKVIKNFSWQEYYDDSFKRKVMERWIENIVMVTLDIAKILLAADKREIPQTYRETLRNFGSIYLDPEFGNRIEWFAVMRNILVHEYLDARWKRIQRFLREAEELIPIFIKKTKELVKE